MSSDSESDSDASNGPEDETPEWLSVEDTAARSMVFLVTFAAVLVETAQVAEVPLKTIDDASRESVRDAVLDAVRNPVAESGAGRPRTRQAEVVKLVVFLEEPKHFHVAIKLTVFSRFLPFKMALRMRSGFATHWSTSHSQWWSAVRYGAFATERKPHVDVTPLVWTASGKSLSLFEESQEPFNAAALKKRREAAAQVAPGQPPSKMPRTDHHLK